MAPAQPIPVSRLQSAAVQLVYATHPRWPLPRAPPPPPTPLRVSVLDSSFNPPTLAHLALANAPPPVPDHDYDAKLLLLSVRNADKTLAPGDADHPQRLDMMVLLARDIVRTQPGHAATPSADAAGPSAAAPQPQPRHPHDNVAVAIIDEPTFVGKSRVLLDFLQQRVARAATDPDPDPHRDVTHTDARTADMAVIPEAAPATPRRPELTFLVGMDTLERLFAPRYYGSRPAMLSALRRFFSEPDPPGSGPPGAAERGYNARVVCARRPLPGVSRPEDTDADTKRGAELLASIHEFVSERRVVLVDIGAREQAISSTEVRRLRRAGDERWRGMVTPKVAEYIERNGLYSV